MKKRKQKNMNHKIYLFFLILNFFSYSSDHCTARCPSIKCKVCGKHGHKKRDCPKLKHDIKDYTKETSELDDDLLIYWGGHCDVCKQGVKQKLRMRGQ